MHSLLKPHIYAIKNWINKLFIGNLFLIIFFGIMTLLSMMMNEIRFLFTDSKVDQIIYSILIFIIIARIVEITIYLISKKNYTLYLFIFDILSLCFLISNTILFYSDEHSNADINQQIFDNFHIFSQVRGYGREFQLNLINSILQCARFILLFIDNNFYMNIAKYIRKNEFNIQETNRNKFLIKTENKKYKTDLEENKLQQISLSQIINFRLTAILFICVLLYPLFSSSVWIQINTSAFSSMKNLSQLTLLRNQYPGDESWPNAYMLELSYFVYTNSIGDSSKWMRLVAIQAPFTLNNNPTCKGCPKSNLEIITNAMSIITNSEFPSWFIEILTLPVLKEGISLIPNEDFNKIRKQSLRQYVSQVCMRSGIDAIANFYSSCPEELKAKITAVFDLSAMIQFGASLTIGISISTLLILLVLTFLVQEILEKHIFSSIRRINHTLISIANNPLLALKIGNNKNISRKEKIEIGNLSNKMLEDTFSKLGTLLAVGLGSAGANIIVQNLKDDKVIVKLPGKKIWGVYGFCDIRNFTDATEILGEDVMLFVNQIAEIAHGIVCKYAGTANKNVGDAFLFVWKPEDKWKKVESFLVDMALLSFVVIIKEIYNCPKLISISKRSDIQERMPNYRVRLGFGLHYGWAIEGAIGSEFKIDASYLSPNVNLSSRLEEATKHYGVNILFSHNLFERLSINMKQFCRKIDCVTLKGSKTPISLYTLDVDPELNSNINKNLNEANYIDDRLLNVLDSEIDENRIDLRIFTKLIRDNGLNNMRKHLFEGFYYKFNKGLKHYLIGNWDKSKEILEKLQLECKRNWGKGDGPTETILEFMKERNFQRPRYWKGYRIWDKK